MSDSTDITVPDLGDFSDVEVIEVLVAEGDSVAAEDGLITLETDKATMDVPSPRAGVIESISIKVGDRVSGGDTIGRMKPTGGKAGNDESGADAGADEEAETKPAEKEQPAQGDKGQEPGTKENSDDKSAKDAASRETTITVPDIGDFSDVEIIEVLVSEGDDVAVDDSLVTLETDKAAMDVPSTVAGKVRKLRVKTGDKVSKGSEIAVILGSAPDSGDEPSARKPEPAKTARKQPSAPAQSQPQSPAGSSSQGKLPAIDEGGFSKAHASPSVRKLARELGVNLVEVRGSGPKERILHDDVKAWVKATLSEKGGQGAALPAVPVVDFGKFGEIDTVPLTRIQKISGPRLQASWINLPHVTQHDLADITELEARRQELKGAAKERGISLTPLAFIMKACIATLKEFPKVNASLSDDGAALVYKKYIHLGFAADTENGLVVPVIRDADKMDVYEIAEQLGTLSGNARAGKLKADQMQGASFTVSSLGGIGGTAFTPIINAPEVAILGVSRASMQPVWNGKEFTPRLMLPLSFSYDHRVIDGAYAARFTTFLAQTLSDVDALLEAIP